MGMVATAAANMVAKANSGGSQGPGNKNLNSNRRSEAHPGGAITSMAGKSIKGPDKGAG